MTSTVTCLTTLAAALAFATVGAVGIPAAHAATPTSSVRINEIESDGGDPGDWVELTDAGTATADLGGYVLTDDDPTHRYVIPGGTRVEPGRFLVIEEAANRSSGFDFGLGSADSVRLLAPDGTVIDEHSWTHHSPTTLGRIPDGTGSFGDTARATKGAPNAAPLPLATRPWPGSPALTPVDSTAAFTGSLSGLDIEPSGTAAPGVLWGVENDAGTLYRLLAQPDGSRRSDPSPAWRDGRTLRFPDGTGTVDAEGVTVAHDSSAGGVYVASERDEDRPTVSRPSVLRYDVSGPATTLAATDEWDLADDLPGLGANSGPEGVTWIPDAFLTAHRFVDARTGRAYRPSDYPGHGGGLFLVGVEGTASVYAYALMPGGTHALIATIPTPFAVVADVQFDRDLGAMWVACDDACAGRTALYTIDASGVFAREAAFEAPADADPALQDEGFAIDTVATCVNGSRATYYADGADTDGHSLRRGSYRCASRAAPASRDPGARGAGGSPGLLAKTGGPAADAGMTALGALLVVLGAGAMCVARVLRRRVAV